MFKHSVQDDKEFTHADSKGHFLSFARGKETLVETPNDGVVPCGYRRGGISRGFASIRYKLLLSLRLSSLW